MLLTNNLYNTVSITKDILIVKLSSHSHPVFKAHFPKNPILPGFLQIDILESELKQTIKKITKAKFLNLVKPEDTLEYKIKELSPFKFKIITFNQNNVKVNELQYEI
jgi:3-hydroxymyristoyl/3-hydroxydecanoyl-(acyl carrier protein) dehydratase